MSKIDAQIKELLLKKKKIDYISYIADLIKNDRSCIDFLEVKDETLAQVEPFLINLIESIEKDQILNTSSKSETFAEDEVSILKTLISKVKNPKVPQKLEEPTKVMQKPKDRPVVSNGDKMNFALSNRHLANREVQVMNEQGANIEGLVVGLDAPNVIVKTKTGPTIEVPLERINLL